MSGVSVDRDGLEIGKPREYFQFATDDDGQTSQQPCAQLFAQQMTLRGNLGSMIIIAMDLASGESVDAVMVEQGDAGYQYRSRTRTGNLQVLCRYRHGS